ncbi:hypothetical protein ACIBSW_34450 [Actinoplanes sp. NPDC049668]|uniref:hypothetical protein n=1 Tax=Actinoplanes sp. NPDC049668 TaxID=3363904 RepID=UPI0037A5D2F6
MLALKAEASRRNFDPASPVDIRIKRPPVERNPSADVVSQFPDGNPEQDELEALLSAPPKPRPTFSDQIMDVELLRMFLEQVDEEREADARRVWVRAEYKKYVRRIKAIPGARCKCDPTELHRFDRINGLDVVVKSPAWGNICTTCALDPVHLLPVKELAMLFGRRFRREAGLYLPKWWRISDYLERQPEERFKWVDSKTPPYLRPGKRSHARDKQRRTLERDKAKGTKVKKTP